MKFSPTAPFALALVAGLTAAAAAQTTPGNGSEPQSTLTKPQAGSIQSQPGDNDNNTSPNAQTQTTPMTTQFGAARTTLPATQAANSADQVKMAQEQLHAAGLYNGPTDGLMDPDTRAALARFQQQNGLRPTQTLDPPTLAHLTANQTAGYGSSAPATSTMTPSGDQPNTSAPVGAGGTTQEKSIKRY